MGGASAVQAYVATAQESEAEEEGRERALVKDDIQVSWVDTCSPSNCCL